jgi:hypothetical protein
MKLNRKSKLVIGAAAVLAAAGGGVGVASSQTTSRSEDGKAVIDDAAKQLGISASKLSGALKSALSNRVDAAVAAGRITKAEGDELKQRITSSDFPLVGGLHHGLGHGGRGLAAAVGYIGITEAQLRADLEGGKSLAQIATAHGKSVDGLVNALVADAKSKLADAVSAGRLTKAQETEMLSGLKDRITSMVNRTRADRPDFGGREFRHFDGPPA